MFCFKNYCFLSICFPFERILSSKRMKKKNWPFAKINFCEVFEMTSFTFFFSFFFAKSSKFDHTRKSLLAKINSLKVGSQLRFNNKNNKKSCEVCSKWTIKTQKRRQWRPSGAFLLLLFLTFYWTCFTPFSIVSILDFEQVYVSLVNFIFITLIHLSGPPNLPPPPQLPPGIPPPPVPPGVMPMPPPGMPPIRPPPNLDDSGDVIRPPPPFQPPPLMPPQQQDNYDNENDWYQIFHVSKCIWWKYYSQVCYKK